MEFKIPFMQKPIIQNIVLVFAILFVFDLGYKLFLQKSYYLQSAGRGTIYRINKRTGGVYLIEGSRMFRVTSKNNFNSPSFLYKLGHSLGKLFVIFHIAGYRSEADVESFFPSKLVGVLILGCYFVSLLLCPFLANKRHKEPLIWLVLAIFLSWIAVIVLLLLGKPKEKPLDPEVYIP